MAVNIVNKIDGTVKIKNVIISVSDKSGLENLVPPLIQINPEVMIYSTGGTYDAVKEILGPSGSKNLMQVSDYTGQPEMQGGLVKTLDFKIYLGLLSETYNADHFRDLRRVNGVGFDLVAVNLYPFDRTVQEEDVTVEKARANIDIGGPCMIRAGAKNFIRVAVLTDPADYASFVEELKKNGGFTKLETRFHLAQKAFNHTAWYDTTIAGFLNRQEMKDVALCYQLMNG